MTAQTSAHGSRSTNEPKSRTQDIQRFEPNKRLSRVVVHDGLIHLSGVTSSVRDDDIKLQTKNVLDMIDTRLNAVGSSKERILSAQIWLKDIARDFDGMNAVWESWIPADRGPARATCEAKLASPDLLVEILIVATL